MSSIFFPTNPIPVVTPKGDGYVLYIKPNGMLENDEFCVVLEQKGEILYFLANQLKVYNNATYGIKKHESQDAVQIDAILLTKFVLSEYLKQMFMKEYTHDEVCKIILDKVSQGYFQYTTGETLSDNNTLFP